MNQTLVIDTSTSKTSVGVVIDEEVKFERSQIDPLTHAEILPIFVAEALEKFPEIGLVAVGMGPGPFTGLRAGISFAQSFALARGIKVVGVCSLDAIAKSRSEKELIVVIDARRKEYFYAKYEKGARIGEPDVRQLIELNRLGLPIIGDLTGDYPEIKNIAALAKVGPSIDSPIYVRRPDAYPAPVGIKFRAMTHLDLVPILAIEKESYGVEAWSMAQLKEESAGKDRCYLVAEKGGQVVGYAGVVNLSGVADVLTVTVQADHRRKGIARELLRRLIDWARTQNCEAIMLEVKVGNEEAMPLYRSFGFVEISRRKDYYGPGKTAIVMRKELR
jgi:tRNA threonylcarbamoyl adenosine modification protein YeaZ/ribosomal-protein-alanine acetyltransferase